MDIFARMHVLFLSQIWGRMKQYALLLWQLVATLNFPSESCCEVRGILQEIVTKGQ